MAKSNATLLKEAIEKGDLEKAKILAEKLEKASKPKPKPKPKPTTRSTDRDADAGASIAPAPKHIILPGEDHIAPTRRPGARSMTRDRTVKGVKARHESMQGRQFKNEMTQWLKTSGRGADVLDKRIEKAEKALLKGARIVPRPGMPGAMRDPAEKVETYCSGCGRTLYLYPSQIIVYDSDSEYKCNRCASRGR